MKRHRLVVAVAGTLGLIAISAATTLGFRTGWLTLTDHGRAVGRLRPTDLIPSTDTANDTDDTPTTGPFEGSAGVPSITTTTALGPVSTTAQHH